MKAYSGFDSTQGECEGACLIFAKNVKEAKKLAYPVISLWYGSEWIEVRTRLLKQTKHILSQAKEELPHVIEEPITCGNCGQWTEEMIDDLCVNCYELKR